MKSAKHRDDMVARVKAAHAKYPTFESLPVGGKRSDDKLKVITWPVNELDGDAAYVAALYEICFRGGVPIGRVDAKDGAPAEIVGEIVAESAVTEHRAGGIVMHAHGAKK